MILFTTLLLTLVVLFVVAFVILIAGGMTLIAVFGDLIVCIILVVFFIKLINRNRRR